ncbi:hypothetical protein BDB01DRAFT_782737 [Pilobolus umbonatus]|nr:hypothetical protein BDB01DRAFT_782737 [Pilobolus umbonatus]
MMSAGKVYSAVYSGVQVYEMMIHGIATMLRVSDSYLNATQILKVAGFEKTRRSKILEREVLTGEHEKVQGGYGKYQGTWIPFERGKELAKKYDVLERMMPLLNFHLSAMKVDLGDLPTKEQAYAEAKQIEQLSSSPRKKIKLSVTPLKPLKNEPHHEQYRQMLMNIFLSENPDEALATLTSAIVTNDIIIDVTIDDQGHAALHWAAALGKVKIAELLINSGSSIYRTNYEGETPLMRAVMIACCYENKCFTDILEMMIDSITLCDTRGRTVFHHIALTAAVEGYADAAVYYMKRILRLSQKKGILKNVLNIKDKKYSETALAIAIRVECHEIIEVLIKYGAVIFPLPNRTVENTAESPAVDYSSSGKGKEVMSYTLDEDYQLQLRKRDEENTKLQNELKIVKYELKELQRIYDITDSRKKQLLQDNKHLPDDTIKIKMDMDSAEPEEVSNTDKTPKERKLEKKLKLLQSQADLNFKLNEKLRIELETVKKESLKREMQYKRLIATSCNIPLDKVEILLEPLTMAIESDPPDLDMTSVIGFMENMKQQKSNAVETVKAIDHTTPNPS